MSGMEILLVASSLAGTALQTTSSVLGAEVEGKIARNNAIQTRAESVEEANLALAEGRRQVAKGRVRAASSGLSVDGSALDVIADMEAEGQYRARTAIHNGRVRYDAYRAEQANAKKKKTLAVAQGAVAMGATALTAGMSAMEPTTVAASKVGTMRDVGKFEQWARGI